MSNSHQHTSGKLHRFSDQEGNLTFSCEFEAGLALPPVRATTSWAGCPSHRCFWSSFTNPSDSTSSTQRIVTKCMVVTRSWNRTNSPIGMYPNTLTFRCHGRENSHSMELNLVPFVLRKSMEHDLVCFSCYLCGPLPTIMSTQLQWPTRVADRLVTATRRRTRRCAARCVSRRDATRQRHLAVTCSAGAASTSGAPPRYAGVSRSDRSSGLSHPLSRVSVHKKVSENTRPQECEIRDPGPGSVICFSEPIFTPHCKFVPKIASRAS